MEKWKKERWRDWGSTCSVGKRAREREAGRKKGRQGEKTGEEFVYWLGNQRGGERRKDRQA